MPNVILRGTILVPDADLEAVRRELPVHLARTRAEPGCRVFEVTPHPHDPNRFDVYEEFASEAAFEAHQVRTKGSRWARVAARVERHYERIG